MDPIRLISGALRSDAADPLLAMQSASLGDRKLMTFSRQGLEVLWRSGNQGGKTLGGARYGLALCRGLRRLDCRLIGQPEPFWVDLPALKLPITHWVLSRTYRQQVDAAQAAYLQLLGSRPHRIAWVNRGLRYVGVIYVKPDNWHSDDHNTWSRVIFHCSQGDSAIGGRIDSAHGDEPPPEEVWREIRARGKANRQLVLYITMTPEDRDQWEWIRRDFGEDEDFAHDGLVQVRTTVYDNLALSDEHRAGLEQKWKNDKLRRARLNGDYIDTSGSCPFDDEKTEVWLSRAEPGIRLTHIVQGERTTPEGRLLTRIACECERWWEVEPDEDYWVILDPSTGVNDGHHDPGHLIVGAVHNPRIVFEYVGYCGAYALGSLAARVGREYNNALVDLDTTGGYGQLTLTGLAASKYRFISSTTTPDRPGIFETRLGFTINRVLKGEFVASIQQVLAEDSIRVPSKHIIQSLRGITVDSQGQPIVIEGRHDEALTTFGRFCYLMSQPHAHRRRSYRKPAAQSGMAAALKNDFGFDVLKGRPQADPPILDRF